VIPELVRSGLAVAVVKHDAHGVDIDRPGKDSDRLFRAGADVALRAPDETLLRLRPGERSSLDGMLVDLAADHDLVLVEGHKGTPLPKVWLAAPDDPAPPDGAANVEVVLPWDAARAPALLGLAERLVGAAHAARPRLGAVLVGGGSTRMGRAKPLLELEGVTFLERVVSALAPHVTEVVLAGAGPVSPRCRSLRRLPDPPGLAGPLAGLLAAMRWAPAASWAVVACDLPRLDRDAVAWLIDQRRPGVWAVLPAGPGGKLEPLAAVYEPQARHRLERLAASGARAPRLIAAGPKVSTPSPPRRIAGGFRNVNTPDELAAVARRRRKVR
jgi:molybdopterin-guanine dinucleotide biosynthesis protein A/molybdopterin-guanine dinucleotide biosynthesis protein